MRVGADSALSGTVGRLLSVLGLPTLPAPAVNPALERAFEEFTSRWVNSPGSPAPLRPPGDTLAYVRWLAAHWPVLFHGSHRDGISELRPDRESRDTTVFGDQRAVFASDDPVWAMWFALLTRGPTFSSTRNGVWAALGDLRRRQYFFSVNAGVPDTGLLTDGWLYVLPRDGFILQSPVAGLLHSGQWVNPRSIRPVARLAVCPNDFPFTDRIGRHDPAESMFRTIWNARLANRRP